MENKLKEMVWYLYLKTGIAAVLAIILCTAASLYIKSLKGLMILPVIVVWFIYCIYSLKEQVKNNSLEIVIAKCEGYNATRTFDKIAKKKDYRFDVIEADIQFDYTFYVTADVGKFKPGEIYALLFRKAGNGSYSEKNLLSSSIIQRQEIETDNAERNNVEKGTENT